MYTRNFLFEHFMYKFIRLEFTSMDLEKKNTNNYRVHVYPFVRSNFTSAAFLRRYYYYVLSCTFETPCTLFEQLTVKV